MGTQPYFVAVVAGTTSIISLQLFGILPPRATSSYKSLSDLGILTSVIANLPANAALNTVPVALDKKDFRVSQATGSRIRFVPPVNKNPRQSQGSGSRGCSNESLTGNLVTLLVPSKDYVGQTISGRPTFFWYLSRPVTVPMQFTLVEDKVGGKTIFKKQIDSPQPGIIQLEFPKNQPELVSGKNYRWTVTLMCNSRKPSANRFFFSFIQRIPTSADLEQQLAATASIPNSPAPIVPSGNASGERNVSLKTLRDRASIYARSGLWYDAIATLSTALQLNPKNSSVQDDFLSLLDQVGLSEVAKQERQQFAKKSNQ